MREAGRQTYRQTDRKAKDKKGERENCAWWALLRVTHWSRWWCSRLGGWQTQVATMAGPNTSSCLIFLLCVAHWVKWEAIQWSKENISVVMPWKKVTSLLQQILITFRHSNKYGASWITHSSLMKCWWAQSYANLGQTGMTTVELL